MTVHATPVPAESAPPEPRFVLSGISKSFPGVRALHNVSLTLYPGQVTALIGENGAGKSTFVKILTGIYQPDTGTISVDGKEVVLSSAHKAFELGITAIHQETVLFDDLTVAENIFLGHAPRTAMGTIDWKAMRSRARVVLDTMHAEHIDTDAKLRDLGIANKHLVAVARAMSIDAAVVIMDEPTAALSAKEIEELYQLIELLKSQGKAVLFISHKFEEIYRISDRYTVLRDGEPVSSGMLRETTQREIVKMMVGRAVDHIFPARRSCGRGGGGPARQRPLASDRIRGHLVRPAPRRDPRLLRPGRRRPERGHAGDLRHHQDDRRLHDAERCEPRPGIGSRSDRSRHRLCA